MAVTDYCLIGDLLEDLQVTDPNEESRLARCITDASRVIDTFCRQEPGTFVAQTKTLTFDSPDTARLLRINRLEPSDMYAYSHAQAYGAGFGYYDRLRIPPLLSATQLSTDNDGDGVFETAWTQGTDYFLLPYNTEVKRQVNTNSARGRLYFPVGQNRIQIAGSWGITESGITPYPIRRAALILSMIYYRRPSGLDKASSGLGGAAVQIGYTDPDIAAILWEVAGRYREQFLAV